MNALIEYIENETSEIARHELDQLVGRGCEYRSDTHLYLVVSREVDNVKLLIEDELA